MHQGASFGDTAANAARIRRLPLEIVQGDLISRDEAMSAVEGCEAVIHLAAGSTRAIVEGTRNLLKRVFGIRSSGSFSSVASAFTGQIPEQRLRLRLHRHEKRETPMVMPSCNRNDLH